MRDNDETILKRPMIPADAMLEEAIRFAKQQEEIACDVLDENNKLLFAGRTGRYDPEENIWQIDLRRGSETPRSDYGMRLKLRIRGIDRRRNAIFYGKVVRCEKERWYIRPEKMNYFTENREFFRQAVQSEGKVCGPDGSISACSVVNISLTGLCFSGNASYEIGEEVELSDIRILPGGHIYTFHCRIVRREEKKYGCQFLNITEKEQDRLWQEILLLQAKSIR